ncbi:dihydrolipoyl dehydrogenase [Paenibacillus psychroresistens]|uniref:Dihydrolipoyl dehydrogenase n=1 Tax=Paenibacillus psychroresistens TaxID=1778678 RepID=A0A6B8RRV3_9BACL|nr:dihydrolipoyl dehydrogenase [Paenibacillus psychroresistens]QGQ97988.1 dihydrolipoyl dehydrogenase [Paenibacillus psychroresistens]
MTKSYDIVVLGGGIGGYTAAIRAAQLGKSVAIVEKGKLGGTCLHSGCIPSKALLRSAEVFSTMLHSEDYGIEASNVSLNFFKVQERKQKIVDQLHKGVQYLMKKNKIDVIEGIGRIIGPSIFSPKSGAIAVELANGEIETLLSENLIIATGSRPRTLPGLEIDGKYIMTSDEALQLETLPKSILIIGGGVIGLEWASLLNDFGVEVTVIEYESRLVPLEDEEISKELERIFKKRKIKVITSAKVLADSVKIIDEKVQLQAELKGEPVQYEAEKVLVSVGRLANIENIGLESTDIKLERGVIRVNTMMQTSESHIYAVGDVIGGLQLAHAAGHEGITAAEHIAGLHPHANAAHLTPRCIYSRPEIASVGWTEKQARERGHEVKIGKFNFKAIGKALVYGDTDGFVKVIADQKTNDILGVHMIGPHVTDFISEAALAHVLEATPWEVGQTIHPHPTLSEALGEAMLAVDGKAIGM